MATRSRGDNDDTPPDQTPDSSVPQTRAARATRSASATNRLRREAAEPVPAPENRAAKAVRASRANARAAANGPAAGASRTVRIRPDTDADEYDDEPELTEGDDAADSTPEPAVVVLQPGAAAAARAPVGTGGDAEVKPAPPRRKAAPRPTSPPAPVPAQTPAVVAPPAAPAPVAPAAAASPDKSGKSEQSGKSEKSGKADKPKKERRPLPNVISVIRAVGDKIGLLAQLAGLIAFLILAIHVLFVASDANANNAIVSWFDRQSNGLVGDFKNIFSAKTAKGRVFYNYGLAAVVYLLAGSLVRRILRK